MNNNKADFQHQITELDNLASTFKQYVNVDDYELISQNARSIKARIDEANEYGKVLNNRENLVGEDITDYTMIGHMAKEFKAYYDLWTTVEVWRKNFSSWLHDAFDEIDSAQVEEIVENSNKLMAATIRFFKDKELPDILRIAEEIKKAVDEFRP
jgi:dynein heavy chain